VRCLPTCAGSVVAVARLTSSRGTAGLAASATPRASSGWYSVTCLYRARDRTRCTNLAGLTYTPPPGELRFP